MNEHANHERRCKNELKRNEACAIDDANHTEDANATDVADGQRPNCLCKRGEGGSWLRSFSRLEIPAHPNTLLKQEGLQLAEASFRDICIYKNAYN